MCEVLVRVSRPHAHRTLELTETGIMKLRRMPDGRLEVTQEVLQAVREAARERHSDQARRDDAVSYPEGRGREGKETA